MAKRKRQMGVSFSTPRFVVYFGKIDFESGVEIERTQIGQFSDEIQAKNFLASYYHQNRWGEQTTFVEQNRTIIQITKSNPDIIYIYYIEDLEAI